MARGIWVAALQTEQYRLLWLINASLTWNNNRFEETPSQPNAFSVLDSTLPSLPVSAPRARFCREPQC